jgi:hypothetical protein
MNTVRIHSGNLQAGDVVLNRTNGLCRTVASTVEGPENFRHTRMVTVSFTDGTQTRVSDSYRFEVEEPARWTAGKTR